MIEKVRQALWPMVSRLPVGVEDRMLAWAAGRRYSPIANTDIPQTPVRLYVAPANYAGQGWAWCRAVERTLPGVGARNMAPERSRLNFPADTRVPQWTYGASRLWQRAELASVLSFTHVLVEAELALFPRFDHGDVIAQVTRLREAGLQVAMISHGSDVRDPDAHAARSQWSPFTDRSWTDVATLRAGSERNRSLLVTLRAQGVPVFVSTPDLLIDLPYAQWCPVVVNVEEWKSEAPVLEREVPVVVHAPSNAPVKGSSVIDAEMADLARRGLIEYRRITGASHGQMVEIYQQADIVIDQLTLGIFGAAACEAMAAGRVVVSHVSDHDRDEVRRRFDVSLPVIEATPANLGEIIASLAGPERDRARAAASAGPGYARLAHDGRASAQTLATFLGVNC